MTDTTEAPTSTRYMIAKEVVEHGVFGRTGSDTPRAGRPDESSFTNYEDFLTEADAEGAVLLEGAILDGMTARALVLVFEALSPAAQAKFDSIPLGRLIDFVWSKVSIG